VNWTICSVKYHALEVCVKAIQARMDTEENYMYPSSSEKVWGDSFKHKSRSLSENEAMDCTVTQQQHANQVVPEKGKEEAENRRQRLRTWSYHCQVPDVEVNKESKLTEAAKLLSVEEMQLLNEDIFNPLDICWIISKNSARETATN